MTTASIAPTVSACMATHNGAKYLETQLRTVLADLSASDEVVIVDDASTDSTIDVIKSFRDPRVRLLVNLTNLGHVRTFARAIEASSGDIICLVDQDDVWPEGRTDVLRSALEVGDAVAGRFITFSDDRPNQAAVVSNLRQEMSDARWRNLIGLALGRRDYYGSTMAFNARLKELILPIPSFVEAHDHWIAAAGALFGRLQHVEDIVARRRIHESNLSPAKSRPLARVLRTRAILLTSIGMLVARRLKQRSSRRSDPRPRICVIYPFIAHYRRSVFQAMHDEAAMRFEFVAGETLRDTTIRLASQAELPPVRWIRNVWIGNMLFQPYVLGHALTSRHDVTVLVGDARFVSNWIAAAILRLRGRRVAFWTIGWHRPEEGIKRRVRLAFYGLADAILVYGETARQIGLSLGFPSRKLFVIGNSHDTLAPVSDLPARHVAAVEGRHWVGAVVRANENKRLDMLVRAVSLIRGRGNDLGVILVGEGPCLPALTALAKKLGVPLRSLGAVHDPGELARVYEDLLVTVVPEAAGLTTIQSLWHGRPVITCADPYRQMPEFEAIVHGETGSLYQTGDLESLASEVTSWVDRVLEDPSGIAARCRREVADSWTAQAHAGRIRQALSEVLTQ